MSDTQRFLNAWMAQCEISEAADAAEVLGTQQELLEQCLQGKAELPTYLRRHAEWIGSSR